MRVTSKAVVMTIQTTKIFNDEKIARNNPSSLFPKPAWDDAFFPRHRERNAGERRDDG